MSARTPRPTDAELAILRVLWEHGPSTVRDVHGRLEPGNARGYTTILKLMQIMADKGLVIRDESERSHVYRPRKSRQRVEGALVRDMIDRVFGGSAADLVVHALAARPSSDEELQRIRLLLDQWERES